MKKRLLKWMTTFVVVILMVLSGGVTASAEDSAGHTGYLDWSWTPPVTEHEWGTYGITSPAHKGTFAYVVSYDTLYKIKDSSGQLIDSVELGGNVMWSKNAPTIAGSKIFVPLAGSKIAIVDISNTNSVELIETITYADGESDYQSNVRAFYDSDSKAVYVGSWGGSNAGTYVKIDVDTYKVTKIADGRGFYCAGAAVLEDYIVFGSEAVDDDAILYAYNKTTGETSKKTIQNSGSIRSSVVVYDNKCYFITNTGNLYEAAIDEEGTITETLIADVGYASVCTTLIHEGYLYAGYQVSEGFESKGGVKAFDLADLTADPKTFAEVPGAVTTLYNPVNRPSDTAVYATYNNKPGGIWDVTNGQDYFVPDTNMQEYCMSTMADTAQRMFYMNDSGNLMALKNTGTSSTTMYKVTATAGDSGTVSPTYISVKENSSATLYFTPDLGYKVASVKVNGVEQELGTGVISSYRVAKVTQDTKVEVAFKKANPVSEQIEVSVQQGEKFYLAHEKLDVSSDLAETNGYTDVVDIETISALDALVAAHLHFYGKDADISQYLAMSGGNPATVMGYTGPSYSAGFAVNENYYADKSGTGYNVNQAPLKEGDRVDFFWYEDGGYMDTVTAFSDGSNKVFSKVVRENESIDVELKGYPIMYYGYKPEEAIAKASVVALEKQSDGSYQVKEQLKDKEGKDISLDAEGKANIDLAPGKYYLSLMKGDYSAKIIMPFLELTVLCDEHAFKDDKCEICEFEKESIEGKAVSGINAEYVYTGSQIKPAVTIAGLKAGTDFTVTYSNNVNIGTATVTIKGIGNYTGTITKTFAILKPLPKEGAVVKDTKNTAKYKVTESERGGVEVSYEAPVNKKKTSVTIPATVTLADGTVAAVTSIEAKAFKNNKKIKKVKIGKNVEEIGKEAFSGAKKLTTVSMGSNVKKIGTKAFYKAVALKKVTISAKTTSIGTSAFSGCKKLTTVKMGKNVQTIGTSAFAKCTTLKSVTLPANVNKIGSKAFYGDKKLKKITIKSKKLKSSKVGKKAFKGVYSKAKVNVPNNKVKAYKKFFYKKGLNKKSRIY